MGDPVFVLTRHYYESYRDLYRLIELAGLPTCYVDEIDAASDNTYILTVRNGEIGAGWPDARARIIDLQLEWFTDYPPIPGVAETWSADAWHAAQIGAKYTPLGSDVRLKHGPDGDSDEYDVAYLGYIVNRRNDILTDLKARGVRVSPTSAWGDDRHRVLTHSTAYLHVHQWDDKPAIPALRMVVAAAYSLPVICELPANRGIFNYGFMLTSDHAHIGQFAQMWAVKERGPFLEAFGGSLHQLLCHEFTFRRSIEAAL